MELGRQQKANALCAVFLGCVNRAAGAEGLAFALVHYRRAWCTLAAQNTLQNNYRGGKKVPRKENVLQGLLSSLWNQVPGCYNVCGAIAAFGKVFAGPGLPFPSCVNSPGVQAAAGCLLLIITW